MEFFNPYIHLPMYDLICLVLIVIGFAGNGLSLFVYTRPSMRKSTVSFFLNSLSVCNILYYTVTSQLYDILRYSTKKLFFFLPDEMRAFVGTYEPDLHNWIVPQTLVTIGRYICVLIAIERWIAVCWPLKVRIWCTFRNCKIALLLIIVIVCGTHAPWYYIWFTGLTFARKHPFLFLILFVPEFLLSYLVASWITDIIIPFVIMFFFNLKVILQLRKSRLARAQLTSTHRNTDKTTLMLITVTFLFALCHSVDVVNGITYKYDLYLNSNQRNLLMGLTRILAYTHTVITFLIYYCFSSKFRAILHSSIRGFFGQLARRMKKSRKSLNPIFV